jgi:hypothetical protein
MPTANLVGYGWPAHPLTLCMPPKAPFWPTGLRGPGGPSGDFSLGRGGGGVLAALLGCC